MEGTHKGHHVYLLAQHRTTQKSYHMSEITIQTLLELWQAQCHDHFPEEAVPAPDQPLSEEPCPDIRSEPPLVTASCYSLGFCSITGHQREEISACPSTPHHEEVTCCDDVSPVSSLLGWTSQGTSTTPHTYSPLDPSPSLQSSFGHSNNFVSFLYCGTQKLNTVIKVRQHESSVEWDSNFPWPASNATLHAPQEVHQG